MARSRWTDERIDDLSDRVDRGFERMDRRFEQIDRRFEQIEASIGALHGTMLRGFFGLAAMIVALFVGAQL